MSEDLEQTLRLLKLEYLSQLPGRRLEFGRLLEQMVGGDDKVELLRRQLHQVAGSGGSYGFASLSRAAREAERLMDETDDWDSSALAQLQVAMTQLEQEIEKAMSQRDGPPEA